MITASCNCGLVRFRLSAQPDRVIQCHCSICRRATGTGGVSVVLVSSSKFEWLTGEEYIQSWRKPDADWESTFCRNCGSPLPGKNDTEHMYVPAGLLVDGIDDLKVSDHIWVGSKAGWDEIGDPGRQHPGAYGTVED